MRDTRTWYPMTPRPGEPSASDLFPANPDKRTIRRWARQGLFGGAVKLQVTYSGGRVGVNVEDAIAFEAAVNRYRRAAHETVEEVRRRTKRQREIGRVMEAIGI